MKLFHMSLLALSVAVPLVAAARPPVPTVPAWPVIPSEPNVPPSSPIPGQPSIPDPRQDLVPVPNPEWLFTSPDPWLHANKQVVYRIIHELLEAGQWDRADRYLTERYIQHNPNAASGREAVVRFFTETLGEKPQPLSPSLRTPILAVIAEGDLVTVLYPRVVRTEQGAYTTTWHDTWRIVGGKADEHWDPALKGESPVLGTP
jgi:predicted SnoaL-like aldol condensation-catalyzing enzyme